MPIRVIALSAFFLRLAIPIQLSIYAPLGEKFFMRALFNNLSLIHNDDSVPYKLFKFELSAKFPTGFVDSWI